MVVYHYRSMRSRKLAGARIPFKKLLVTEIIVDEYHITYSNTYQLIKHTGSHSCKYHDYVNKARKDRLLS